MALMNCPDCNNKISDSSNQCVHCGYIIPKNVDYKKYQKNSIMIAIIFVLITIIVYCVTTVAKSIDEVEEAAEISSNSAKELNESAGETGKMIVEGK